MFEKDMMMVGGGEKPMIQKPKGGYLPQLMIPLVVSVTGNVSLPFWSPEVAHRDS